MYHAAHARHFGPVYRSKQRPAAARRYRKDSLNTTHHESGAWFTRERILVLVLAVITAFFFYLCYQLVLPFVPALTWALAIAVVAHPVHDWMQRRLNNKSLVAALAVVAVTATILAPAVFIVQQVSNDAVASAGKMKEALAEGRWREFLKRNAVLAPVAEWIDREASVGEQVERALGDIVGGAKKVISSSIHVVTGLLITLFLLFYFFRDKEIILGSLRRSFPLSPREHKKSSATCAIPFTRSSTAPCWSRSCRACWAD